MYGEVKNPFGIRNGVYITVNDLREDERGLACGCICPLCKDPFEARLGSIRIHHFAHSGEGCDEIASYLMGLYGFFKDYLDSHNGVIPDLNIYYHLDKRSCTPITQENYTEQIRYYPDNYHSKRISLSRELAIRFESTEIAIGKNKRPEAVIATYHGKRIAFVISPPDTICKDYHASPYKNIATLEIMLSKKADLISRANSEMMNAIFSDLGNYRWLSSPLVFSSFKKINEERREAYEAYQEEVKQQRIRQEEADRKRKELERQENERRKMRQEELRKAAAEKKERELQEQAQREENDRRMIQEQIKIPNQQVVDSEGRRWFQCEICGKIATEEEFWTYQWNRGQCKECRKKQTSSNELDVELMSHNIPTIKANIPSDICPWCGGRLIKRNGRNGAFLGCSSYPRCTFSRKI